MIGETYASRGIGSRPLAACVNAQGYRTVKGRLFTGSSIRTILENAVYAGWLVWHPRKSKRSPREDAEQVRGPHEPLWSDELFEQIQIVRRRQLRGSNGGALHNVYPFRRITICDRCNRPMYGEAHKTTLYMACANQRERHDCGQSAVRNSRLEDQVGERLTTLRVPEDWRADIERMQRGFATAQEQRPAVDTSRIDRQLANLRELFIADDITRDEYVGRSRALRVTLDGGRPQPTYSEAVLVKAARLLTELGNLWSKATPEERRELAQTLIGEVRVRDDAIVSVTLARDEYLPLIASAMARTQVGVARPEVSGFTT